jgi:2-polyprenyl-3-methyl-5-hydroxy-6-metoxy-1,4-benzoquinol methylase
MSASMYYRNVRPEMLDFVPRDAGRILEVGCGEGLFGRQLIDRQGAEVWGVEPNAEAAKVAATHLTKAENGLFGEGIAAPRNYFDCIIFNDVLEHMEDPWQALRIAERFLRDGNATVVASIPNFRHWDNLVEVVIGKDFRYKEAGILDKTHLRFFTEKSIRDFFADAGYGVVRMAGINPTASRKFKLINFLSGNAIRDMRYLQYGVVAKPAKGAKPLE